MRRHLNSLYITTQGTYLASERETTVVKFDGEVKLRVPLHLLENIVCFGRISVSPYLMAKCGTHGVGISYLTERGRFLARVHGPVSGNVLLRREQYRRSDQPVAAAEIARSIVAAKVLNSRTVLKRAIRDNPGRAEGNGLPAAAAILRRRAEMLSATLAVDKIRGIEGDAARVYFGVFNDLIVTQNGSFYFNGRTRRPPADRVNALLSFVYTLLTQDIASALEAVGLDPQVGFLHRDRPGRLGLALDLAEEFRAFIGDRLALTLINRGQIRAEEFETRETGAVWMKDTARKTVLETYQLRKNDEITHPFIEEKTTIGMLLHLQALLLARHLRGDLDAYPPFVWR